MFTLFIIIKYFTQKYYTLFIIIKYFTKILYLIYHYKIFTKILYFIYHYKIFTKILYFTYTLFFPIYYRNFRVKNYYKGCFFLFIIEKCRLKKILKKIRVMFTLFIIIKYFTQKYYTLFIIIKYFTKILYLIYHYKIFHKNIISYLSL